MQANAYNGTQKFLHWTMFVLVVGLYAITYAEGLFDRGTSQRAAVWWLHISFGLVLLPLVFWRIGARLSRKTPSATAKPASGAEEFVARITHIALYALLVALPLIGVALAWLRGNPLSFFGLFTIPAPFLPNRELGSMVQEVHGFLAHVIVALAAVHAFAALWHHFVRRDGVLKGMLP